MIYIILVVLCSLYVANMINIVPGFATLMWKHPEDEQLHRVPHVYRLVVETEDQPLVIVVSLVLASMLIIVGIDHPVPWLLAPEVVALMIDAVLLPMSFRSALYLDRFAAQFPRVNILGVVACKWCTGAGLLIACAQL
jgi:hypothetical protein